MDVLVQKPKGPIKIWTLAGIIAVAVFFVSYVFIALYYAQASAGQLPISDYIGLFISAFNGISTTAILVFFIGLFVSKKKNYFLKFMFWTILLTGLYRGVPNITSLFQVFTAYSGLELMFYLGLILPTILACALLVSAILQKDSENTSITNMIAWICIVVDVLLVVFQFVYVFSSNTESMSSLEAVFGSLSGSFYLIVLICLAFVFLNATKAAVKNGIVKETSLDELVEKIAKEPKKVEENLEEMVEKVSRDD